ncbi:MAG: WD40 repeat domain-containing serine/threonine protein kinase, partial [Akkermansiaceae bacterium]|nr:WD40 repeat domain-containing serine/threonine protein kinase [Akkermansiaceae bacterium]
MSEPTKCPRCGALHPKAIAGGLCPHCLLSGLLGTTAGHRPGERPGERPGDAVGPYELIDILGEGGMGSVWRARQLHPVEREAALKIIKLGMDTRELVSRFEAERQSLAMMDHPGIARVYEAGATDEGRPYFAMELVDGEPVTDYCVSHKLPVEERLRLFIEICAAVAHAHRKGVLHRDIKPSNVMVVARPRGAQVKVIDFGIAKLLEAENDGRTFATRLGHAVGTPGYMSPEQAGAEPDVDTRSDVYSLGALLYEMLTGTTPLGKETFREVAHAEVLRLIRETIPPRPSARLGPTPRSGPPPPVRIARDLDRIVMKALARERERRYGGAASLGEDVRRFLNHEPVSATDPTVGYRAAMFVRKHRLAVAFSALLVLGLLVSLILVIGQAGRADQAARAEKAARLVALSTLADSYRNAGLAAGEQRQDALAALWFTEAAEVAAHDPERMRANRLRAGLHAARAPLMVRMIPVESHVRRRLTFDLSSSFLHLGWGGTKHSFLDVERGTAIKFDRELDAACWSGPAEAAISSPGGFELRDLRSSETLHSVAVEDPVRDLWASGDGSLLLVVSSHCRVWNRKSESWKTGPLDQQGRPRYAAFSQDGTWVLTIDEHACLRVFPT